MWGFLGAGLAALATALSWTQYRKTKDTSWLVAAAVALSIAVPLTVAGYVKVAEATERIAWLWGLPARLWDGVKAVLRMKGSWGFGAG